MGDWTLAHPWAAALLVAAAVILAGTLLHLLVRRYLLRFLAYVAQQTSMRWDQAFFDARLPHRLAWAVPILVWYAGVPLIPYLPLAVDVVVRRVLLASLVVVGVRGVDALLDAVNRIYMLNPRGRERPIKGFLQVANVLAHMAGLIWVIALLMDRSPVLFLSGLGAMTAVLLLVFRDTLLSLVAGIQITTNDLIRVGDWIEMPQFQADGDVIDIALNSVSVLNWDKTITVIPTHKFLEHSFKNWRNMYGVGRQIKRSISIDTATIRFLAEEEIQRFRRFALLTPYIDRKVAELEEFNARYADDPTLIVNQRRLTNIGTFRAYVDAYLRNHPMINDQLTFLVRQLQPTAEGLPIQLYVYTTDTRWAVYEGVQADVFDHLHAILPEFGLRVYQTPSGGDVRAAIEAMRAPLAALSAGD